MKKGIIFTICILASIIGILTNKNMGGNTEKVNENANNNNQDEISNEQKDTNIEVDDWRLILVNYENALPEDFNIELSDIDKTRKFDSRAIDNLKQMLQAMKDEGISDIWVQSSYRSIDYQQKLFDEQVNEYIKQGKTKEEAETLTMQTINKPGTSEHNLGLAVDFNYVNYDFENTKAFKWLLENAESYGFILRYKKEKEDITKVDYEPWHWRYIGVENAKKINELNMCLEEYIDYLNSL